MNKKKTKVKKERSKSLRIFQGILASTPTAVIAFLVGIPGFIGYAVFTIFSLIAISLGELTHNIYVKVVNDEKPKHSEDD